MLDLVEDLLEPHHGGFELSVLEMVFRAALIYCFAVAMVRLGNKRFMGRNSAFDLILGIILGSVLSRGITGQSPFWPTMAAGAMLMLIHWLLALVAYYWSSFGPWVKGEATLLVKDGQVLKKNMRRSRVGNRDLDEALRSSGLISLEAVAQAHLERNGNISVIARKPPLRVLEVAVQQGVQTVRIEIPD